jgi:hypothetical protein
MSKPSKNQSRSIPSLFLFNIEERELWTDEKRFYG